MTTEQQPSLSESERQEAFLAELEAERQRRMEGGNWTRTRPILQVLVADTETDLEAQQRALAEHLKEHKGDPKSVHAYQWILLYAIGPPPIVQTPSDLWDDDDVGAVDVTPWRPPMPAATPASPPTPPPPQPTGPPSNAGIPPQIHARELRRLARFESDEYSIEDAPLRYLRGRTGY